jgi:hypothetical protein
MMPTVEADASSNRAPVASLLRWNPVLPIGAGVGLVVALVLSAAYPAPAQETTGMAMSGMAGMSGATPSERHRQHGVVHGRQRGDRQIGIGPDQHPLHDHGGQRRHEHERGRCLGGGRVQHHQGQLGATPVRRSPPRWPKSCWPMARTVPTRFTWRPPGAPHSRPSPRRSTPPSTYRPPARRWPPTQSRRRDRRRLCGGFAGHYPVVYYVNPSHRGGQCRGQADAQPRACGRPGLCPDAVGPRGVGCRHVRPAFDSQETAHALRGSRAVASAHRGLRDAHGSADVLNITGVTLRFGSVQRPTPYLTMVWQIPVAGGPTAIQPPDIQIVEAAVMAETS